MTRDTVAKLRQAAAGEYEPSYGEWDDGPHRAVPAAFLLHVADLLEVKAAPKKRRSGGITRDSADIRFSRQIRERDRWTCQRCGKVYDPSSQGLHCAHNFSRRIKATRLDPLNACALCYGCHAYIDSHPAEKIAFFRERLGDERFDALSAKANARRDRANKGEG